jgi:hypothetical protein
VIDMPAANAGVAQLVEQRIRNAKVGSSTLLAGTNSVSDTAPVMALPAPLVVAAARAAIVGVTLLLLIDSGDR